jgi:hypothetical protein
MSAPATVQLNQQIASMLQIHTGLIAVANAISGLLLEKTKVLQMPNVP